MMLLNQAFESEEAEFIAVYGRRRVGKTFLIRRFFEKKACLLFQLTGIHNAKLEKQLTEFNKELERLYQSIGIEVQLKTPSSWLDAFEALTAAINYSKDKVVLFFDEFPWMATKKSQLLQALDYYWNRYWVDNQNIKLIICGSAASWIIKNILSNRGGLHNRVTSRLLIEPFSLSESQQYLTSRHVLLDPYQVLQLYMCIGGIPFYLKSMKQGFSATQNINQACFSKRGTLVDEFNNLFSSLFQQSETHENIVRQLAQKRNGVNRTDLARTLNIDGGALTRSLRELEQAGFIEKFTPWNQKKGIFYKLIDEYSLFYLNWITQNPHDNQAKKLTDNFWDITSQSATWKGWASYAFEAICFKHIDQIKTALNVPDGATASAWRSIAKKSDKLSGAQIDLLFDRPDGIIHICEIKYANAPFNIDKDYASQLRNKLEIYTGVTKTKKQLVLSMITTYGLKKSIHTEGLVWSQATLDDLFKQ